MAPDASAAVPPVAPPVARGTSGTKMIVTMGGLGFVCAILIVAAFQVTKPAIERNKAAALERAIFDVIPAATTKRVFAEQDGRLVPEADAIGGRHYYAGYDADGRLVGVAVEASGQGFADLVKVIYGYAPDQSAIVGMKVLESHETPGLGTKIDSDPAFRANFDALEVKMADSGAASPIRSCWSNTARRATVGDRGDHRCHHLVERRRQHSARQHRCRRSADHEQPANAGGEAHMSARTCQRCRNRPGWTSFSRGSGKRIRCSSCCSGCARCSP